MRLTIIPSDNFVLVDGVARTVDCSAIPANVHAVQWNGTSGEVEYKTLTCDHCGVRSRKANDAITSIEPYQKIVDAWHAAGPEN
jgi:hypothetical protein